MSRQRLTMTMIGGVSMLGVIFYATRKNERKSDNTQIRKAAPSGSERDIQSGQVQLPTGGVGGGEASSKADHLRLHTTSILSGGGKGTASRQDHEGYHDTKGISKMGSEIPSKKGPADTSEH
ncbi:hypothetical protein J3E69DRAFT_335540 [Trichoderma sp. SZMC 28015]